MNKIIAIAGQPNCGKTTIFNKITGLNQIVGNWPGVTVERKEGKIILDNNKSAKLIDLPGVYGLSPISLDEKVTRDFLINNEIDLLINVIDGTNFERSLFLTIQLLTLNIPMIIVINMCDILKSKKIEIDINKLKYLLGVKIITVSGRTGENIDYLKEEIKQFFNKEFILRKSQIQIHPNDKIYSAIISIKNILLAYNETKKYSEFYALKLLEGNRDIEKIIKKKLGMEKYKHISTILDNFGDKKQRTLQVIEWIYSISRGISEDILSIGHSQKIDFSDVLDVFLLNKIMALPVFLISIFILFALTFFLGDFFAGIFENVFEFLSHLIIENFSNNFLTSLITDGIIGGVGNVLSLLPYIFIMFIIIQFYEDSGYMARIAFIMDRFMHKIGLHGKSFIPLVMGFGCSVPAIMAARTLDTEQNRLKTILMIPFVPCSARLTVVVLLSGALFGKKAPLFVFLLYMISVIIAIISGFIFNKTLLKEKSEGMIMELPDYRIPQLKNLFIRAWIQSREYLIKAGSLIFFMSVILFILSYFPRNINGGTVYYLGKYIQPFFKPLDFDLPMTISLISGFFAKEAVISTLSILYNNETISLSNYVAANWNYLTAFVYMVFIMIYIPCIATVIIIKHETNSYKWTIFLVLYSIIIAYLISYIVKIVLQFFGL